MGNFGQKVSKFIEIFIEQNGYVRVLEGLKNTLLIAVIGLIIGIVLGTLIATVRVIPKYKVLPRVLNGICSFYVGLFRGTPMVVQLLVFYYVLLHMPALNKCHIIPLFFTFRLLSFPYLTFLTFQAAMQLQEYISPYPHTPPIVIF